MRFIAGAKSELDELVSTLADDNAARIIAKTLTHAASARQISEATKIPLSTVYRQLERMKKIGLMQVERVVLSNSGRKTEFVRTTCKALIMDFSGSDIFVEVEFTEATEATFSRLTQTTEENSNELLFVGPNKS